jgi:hypothetical protein
MIPFMPFIPTSVESADLSVRVQHLEKALAASFGLLYTLFERLEVRLGPGFLGEELGRMTAVEGWTAEEEVTRIDTLLQQGQQPVLRTR